MMMYEFLFQYLSLSNVNGLMLYADVNMKYILFYVKGLLYVFSLFYFYFYYKKRLRLINLDYIYGKLSKKK